MILSFHPTLRALITAVFAGFLFIFFAWKDNDILASYTVLTLCTSLFFSFFLVLVSGRRIKKNMSIQILSSLPADSKSTTVFSKSPSLFHFSLKNCSILPLTDLSLRFIFQNDDAAEIFVVINASSPKDKIHQIPFVYEHRGIWNNDQIEWKIQDSFGFWNYQSKKSVSLSSEATSVYPAPSNFESLEPLFSSVRDGDDQLDSVQLGGDLYDIKRYHPSDGLRKIVWKVFARTGELLSRHPEKTMTPDGKIILYVAGGKLADNGYWQCSRYMQQMKQIGLDVLSSGLQFGSNDACPDPESFLDKAVISAFNPINVDGIHKLFSEEFGTSFVSSVGLFIDLTSHDKEELDNLIKSIREIVISLKEKNIKPVILYFHAIDDSDEQTRSSHPVSKVLELIKEKSEKNFSDSFQYMSIQQSFLNELQDSLTQ
jgi:hypothetical protein